MLKTSSMNSSDEESGALICQAVYLLRGMGQCHSCEKTTQMFALMVLPPFALEGAQFEPADEGGAMLRRPEALPPELEQEIRPISGNSFRHDNSKMAGQSYWMNHCEHCDAKQGDHFVQGPDGPFWPYDEAQMQGIVAQRFEGPYRLPNIDTSYSGAMAAWRDWKHGVEPPSPPARKSRRR